MPRKASEIAPSQEEGEKLKRLFAEKPRSNERFSGQRSKKFNHNTRLKIIEIACRKPEEITHRFTRAYQKSR